MRRRFSSMTKSLGSAGRMRRSFELRHVDDVDHVVIAQAT